MDNPGEVAEDDARHALPVGDGGPQTPGLRCGSFPVWPLVFGNEKGPLDGYLLPGLEDPLGGASRSFLFQGDPDQLLELGVLEDLEPLQVPE